MVEYEVVGIEGVGEGIGWYDLIEYYDLIENMIRLDDMIWLIDDYDDNYDKIRLRWWFGIITRMNERVYNEFLKFKYKKLRL